MGLCPPVVKGSNKWNFYLRSIVRTTPAQWYSSRVMGVNAIKKVVGEMLKDVKLDGFFSNHSLRRSGTTRLFQAGVDRKIVKEYTRHVSNAVDQYQVTSHSQRKSLSNIIQCKPQEPIPMDTLFESKQASKTVKHDMPSNDVQISVSNDSNVNTLGCCCSRKNVDLGETKGLGVMINDILQGRKYAKATIKIDIDLKE